VLGRIAHNDYAPLRGGLQGIRLGIDGAPHTGQRTRATPALRARALHSNGRPMGHKRPSMRCAGVPVPGPRGRGQNARVPHTYPCPKPPNMYPLRVPYPGVNMGWTPRPMGG